MPVPNIVDLDPASDARFRDVYGRHHNRMVTRNGNLIRTIYHHVSGAQANVSAAEIVSIDASENAQFDLLLRNSSAPIALANLTSSNINTWSASSLLSLRQGTTAIRSANVSVGNVTATSLNVTTDGVSKLDNCIVRSFKKVLPANSGSTAHICTISNSNGIFAAELNVVMSSTAWDVRSKTYKFSTHNNATNNNWRLLLPLTTSAESTTPLFETEIRVNAGTTTLRLVRTTTLETTDMECTLTVYQTRAHPVTITGSSTTETGVTLSTTIYGSTPLTQVNGNVGILAANPVYPLQVNGRAYAHQLMAATNFTGTPSLEQGGHIAWNTTAGVGEMDFVCKSGNGTGGFNFYNSSGSGTPTTINSTTLLASIASTGAMTLGSGSVNQVVRSTSSTSQMQSAMVTADSQTGTITFPTAFASAPMVFTQVIIPSGSSGQLFGVMVHTVTATGFSYKKYYQQGGTTFNSSTEDWYWLAVGNM